MAKIHDMKICIINGPNLNLLGRREPDVYGQLSFEDFLPGLRKRYPEIVFDYYQSNVEGELINRLHADAGTCDAIILNAGAYTHTSVALGDAVAAIEVPVVEVHISNVYARESFRHQSHIGPHCKGVIAGFGLDGYRLAVESLCL